MTNELEHALGRRIASLLDAGAARLPYRVVQRLDRAREQALARLPERQTEHALVPARAGGRVAAAGPSWLRRALTVTLPPLVVAAGLYGIGVWTDAQDAQELADVDAGVLVDDVPISAYADRGFGVYLNNNTHQ